MKFAHLLGLVAVMLAGLVTSAFASEDERIQYVEVKQPFVNIYVRLDPKSEIIRQTRKGEYLELLSQGDLWYKVRVDGKDGFVESKAGRVVNRQGASVITLLVYVILLLGSAGAVVMYVRKQQKALAR